MITILAAVNLLTNAGFEQRGESELVASDWELDPASMARAVGEGRNGTCAIRFEAGKPEAKGNRGQKIAVTPGHRYRFEAWIRCEGLKCGARGASVFADWIAADGTWLAQEYPTGIKGTVREWTKISAVTRRMPKNAKWLFVHPIIEGASEGKAYYDDLKIIDYDDEAVKLPTPDRYANEAEAKNLRVAIDREGRVVVDGKKFFPLGFYNGGLSQGQIKTYWCKSPFNCVMPYSMPSREDVEVAWAHGLMVVPSLKDMYYRTLRCPKEIGCEADETEFVISAVKRLKDLPGVLGWYINDELDVGFVPRFAKRRALLEKIDPNHPTWSCIYQVEDAADYQAGTDINGSDPYPIPGDISRVLTETRMMKAAAGKHRAVWQTLQIFDWSDYHHPARPGERLPTQAEIENMTWQAIAGGASGIFYYTYNALSKNREPGQSFERRWKELREVAQRVVDKFPIILADEVELSVEGKIPEKLGLRAWKKDGKIHVLLVNATRETMPLDFKLSEVGSIRNPLAPLEVRCVAF